ncbi:uncharacterized protein [Triticum aestivum]|uniref:uncharacterized protein n=1 Tax=Triticum aestivum TaxID=4565 RepID=UPI001D01FA49|nr:uncharacterized protein LOC123066629 [Triticum aestivum]
MQEGELEELEKGVEPAWERLVHPLNCIVDRLNVVDHIKAVKDSPDLRAAVEDIQEKKDLLLIPTGCAHNRPWIDVAGNAPGSLLLHGGEACAPGWRRSRAWSAWAEEQRRKMGMGI